MDDDLDKDLETFTILLRVKVVRRLEEAEPLSPYVKAIRCLEAVTNNYLDEDFDTLTVLLWSKAKHRLPKPFLQQFVKTRLCCCCVPSLGISEKLTHGVQCPAVSVTTQAT